MLVSILKAIECLISVERVRSHARIANILCRDLVDMLYKAEVEDLLDEIKIEIITK